MEGIFYGIAAMLGFGIGNVAAAKSSRAIGVRSTMLFRGILMVILLSLALPLTKNNWQWGWALGTLLLGVLGYFSLMMYYKGLETGKMGVVSPIASCSSFLTVLLAIIFLGSKFTLLMTAGVAAIITGIILLTINLQDIRSSDLLSKGSGVPYALLTFVGWGVLFFLFTYPVRAIGPGLTALMLEIGMLACLAFAQGRISVLTGRTVLHASIISVSGAISVVATNIGIATAGTALVTPIMSAYPMVIAIIGRLLGEKMRLMQWAGAIITTAGIIVMSL